MSFMVLISLTTIGASKPALSSTAVFVFPFSSTFCYLSLQSWISTVNSNYETVTIILKLPMPNKIIHYFLSQPHSSSQDSGRMQPESFPDYDINSLQFSSQQSPCSLLKPYKLRLQGPCICQDFCLSTSHYNGLLLSANSILEFFQLNIPNLSTFLLKRPSKDL